MQPRTVSEYQDVRYVQGYVNALLWRMAMEAAIDRGHSPPTGHDLKAALEAFTAVDMGGLTAGPLTFTAKDHRPQSSDSIYMLDSNGGFTFVSKYSIELVPDWLGY
jgi:branched-chain amino acid transport system substrate-binding protein